MKHGKIYRESLKAVGGFLLAVYIDLIMPQKVAQNGTVGLMVITKEAFLTTQDFFGRVLPLQFLCSLFHRRKGASPAGSAGRKRQDIDPGYMLFLLEGGNVHIQGIF
jgi:hypothetical protein